MKHMLHLSANLIGIIITIFLLCIELPQDPAQDPNNSDATIFIDKNLIIHQGDAPVIGLSLVLTRHFQSISVTTSCGAFSTLIAADTLSDYDTVYFKPLFNSAGPCSVFVSAQYRDSKLKDLCDTLLLYILSAEPGIHFVTTPPLLKTGIGKTDTLLYVTKSTGEITSPPTYSIVVEPLEGITVTPIYSQLKDTLRVAISSVVVNTYKLKIVASVSYNNSQLKDSVTTEVQVSESGMLVPSKVKVPQTISIGVADTLLFAIDNSNRTDKLSIKLVTEPPLDPAVFTILPTGSDSIFIKVFSAQAITAKAGIIVSNGIRIDTTWYSVSIGNPGASLWNKTEVAVASIEGKLVKLDLRQYFIKPQTGTVTFVTDVGIVKDTFWEWTPPFGTDAAASAILTATKDTTLSKLKLMITVSPSDSIKPSISLVDKALNGKKVSGSSITVECSASDHESGIGSVKFSFGSTSVDAMWQHDSVYSGVISGLKNGIPTEITVTATDKSMKKNSKTISFTVTYDSTMVDEEKPAIAYLSGPKNGERVKDSSGVVDYSIIDNSGVDSVWWTLNGTYAGKITKTADNKYSVHYTLKKYGKNTIVVYAQDGSVKKNVGSTEVNLTYNTALSAVVPEVPANKAVNISTEPVLSWTGAIDSDGDTVYYKVFYGTAENSLVIQSTELKERSFSIVSANKLSANSAYYWQIIAYTKQPYTDTVKSAVVSFTTAGSGPSITTNLPATTKVIEGTTLSLKIVATGTPSPTFKWYKDDELLSGQTGVEFTKSNVTAVDSGTYYVVVNNGVGTDVISTKTVVTIRFKAAITQDPVATTVNEGGSGTFSVKAIGEAPLSYQWLKDGVSLPGDTSATYSITGAKATDDGKKFSCIVSNPLGKDTSVAALLTVTSKPVYIVTFNAGPEVTSPEAQQVAEGGKVTQPLAPTRVGYDFIGWYKESTLTNAWVFTTDVVTGPVTLYAKWSLIPTFTVTYNGNGNTGGTVPIDVNTYVEGATVTAKTAGTLVRSGYDFVGWNTAANGGGTNRAVGSKFPIGNSNITLYAVWSLIPTYTVTYNGNGNTGGTVPTDANNYVEGTTVTVKTVGTLVRDGYEFVGWNTLANGNGTSRTEGSTFAMGGANVTLYAVWSLIPTYTVTYNGNGNTGGTAPTDANSYTQGATVTVKTAGTMVREGYEFLRWNTLANGSGTNRAASSTFAMGGANVTLYAVWSLIPTYTVTYNGNGYTGGTVPTDANNYTQGATVTVKTAGTMVREGYEFLRWNTLANGSGTNRAANSTFVMGSSNVTLYAVWSFVPTYTVTYNGNGYTGGTVPTDANSYTQGATATIKSAGTMVRSGYVFSGWNTAANGSGTDYPVGASYTTNANLNLYAKWEVQDYDGNVYTTVTIGTQVWMVENLKTTHYRNGTEINFSNEQETWTGESNGAYCWYDKDVSNNNTYGALYNWRAVNTENLAPKGWHVPTAVEWFTLINYLGGTAVAGVKLKEAGTTHWVSDPDCPSCVGTNSSGFTALPGGSRFLDGNFSGINSNACWWTATQEDEYNAWYVSTSAYGTSVNRSCMQGSFNNGCSIRCVKDY